MRIDVIFHVWLCFRILLLKLGNDSLLYSFNFKNFIYLSLDVALIIQKINI